MVKEIILIIFLFSYGELSLPSFPFEGTVIECLDYGNKLRVELSEYKWNEEEHMKSGWFLKDGSGTWHGFICQ
tara:strand:- start:392 stop:610 length:219 start_codon:yes stop_codon:yes gene_type:complete